MAKIVLIGAGSAIFARHLIADIALTPALADGEICLMDTNAARLSLVERLGRRMVAQLGTKTRIEATTERKQALRDADYVITTFLVGGEAAATLDLAIGERYGLFVDVGDTANPSGVFLALRTIPILLDICHEMDALAHPDALLLNYVNPMAMNTWAIAKATGRPNIGLCHSVQGTAEQLAQWIGADAKEISYWCAGINHMAWYLEYCRRGEDAYPAIRQAFADPELQAAEPVRADVLKHFGYFVTESTRHMADLVPYYRMDKDLKARMRATEPKNPADPYETRMERMQKDVDSPAPLLIERSHEYATEIIAAIEANSPMVCNGNVMNTGLITNLPSGSCVLTCLVDGRGVHPCFVGDLPPQLAALNRSNISMHELAVAGALKGDRQMVAQACKLDPLAAAKCSLDQLDTMVNDFFVEEARWLPQFAAK